MLLAVDAGNTHTVIGLFDGPGGPPDLLDHWRVSTDPDRTADELAMLVRGFLAGHGGVGGGAVTGMAVCSGVPRVTAALREMADRYLGVAPLVVGAGVKTGIPVLYDNPRDVGPDRIANAVGALDQFRPPIVVVDFGTATTLDGITADGEYLGGAIAPGVEVGLDALYERAAMLRRVELTEPHSVVGRNTIESIQSGVLFGTAALVDGLVERMELELGEATVVATGGLCGLIARLCRTVDHIDPWLTLRGLRLLHERNPA